MDLAAFTITRAAHRRLKAKAVTTARELKADVKAIKSEISLKWESTMQSVTYGYIRGMVADTFKGQVEDDPWLKQGTNDELVRLLDKVIDELKLREKRNMIEEHDVEYKERMRQLVKPENWPHPPSPRTQPLSWLRARFLYAIFPADKNATYRQQVAPWMFGIEVLFYLPYCIGTTSAISGSNRTGTVDAAGRSSAG